MRRAFSRFQLRSFSASRPDETANNAKEMWAYAHPKYVEHLQEIKRTVLNYEKLRAQREAATRTSEASKASKAFGAQP